MEKNPDLNLSLLKDEYLMVQEFYQDIDRRCFTIMGWSITVAMAAIGAGIVYGQSVLLLIASLAAVMFWYVEATWRGLGHFMSVRINQIEDGIEEGRGGTMIPLQLYSEWDKEFRRSGGQTWRFFFKSLTPIPHIFIAIVSLGLFVAVSAGWIELI